MTYEEISRFAPINDVDTDKVAELAASIEANGWQGMPILVAAASGMLITGSHRFAALATLDDADDMEVAEDVQDIIDAYCEENDVTIDELPYDNLSAIFRGTWVEEYKDELEEW